MFRDLIHLSENSLESIWDFQTLQISHCSEQKSAIDSIVSSELGQVFYVK